MDVEDARTIGRRLRQIREVRGKSLRVIAGLAGMSTTKLWRIEHGEHALDSLSEIVALANALQIAPSELMRLPVPAPANGNTDSAVETMRSALVAVGRDRPGGQVVPLDALRARVTAMLGAHYSCRQDSEVGAALPGLIRGSAHQHRRRARRRAAAGAGSAAAFGSHPRGAAGRGCVAGSAGAGCSAGSSGGPAP